MAVDRRKERKTLLKIETLAKELSSSVRLSFAEPLAGAFHAEAKAAIVRARRTYETLVENLTERARGTPGIETLLDNSHKIASVLTEISDHWRRKETLRLPQTFDDAGKRRPRAYLIARALVREADAGIDRETVTAFLKEYQRKAPLSVRELDIFPDMLRFVLIEELSLVMDAIRMTFVEVDDAERWLARMLAVLKRRDAEASLAAIANELTQEHKVVAVHFGFHLLQRIAQSGRERDLRIVCRRLKLSLARQGVGASRLPEMVARGEREQAVVIDRAIASLHWLGQMRWDRISPPLNAVDLTLARDPSGAFSALTDDAQAMYRRAIVRIADRTGAHDVEVAREALRLARAARMRAVRSGARGATTDRESHVGYYLADRGVRTLETAFLYEPGLIERLRRAIVAQPTAAYLGVIGVVTAALTAFPFLMPGQAALPLWTLAPLFVAALLLASEVATAAAHLIFTRVLPPRQLPQIDLEDGVGAARRTVVAVPSFIRDSRSTERLLSRLETNFIANDDPDVAFAALLDFRDAPAERMPDDDALLAEIRDGIARLNAEHPSAIPRFTVFVRRRIWNPNEGVFMGWERKRGKLREFNRLLRGETTSYEGDAVEAAGKFGKVRYVLAIDEDTELARDSARALIGTIDHPLNRPVIDPARRVVTDGYGIVMPRAAIRFSEGSASLFSRIFGGLPGIEAYSTLASDLHQDLFGEGIFQGKGIYDIDAVETTMAGRMPENTVLSHDLLEGLYARAGIAANAHIFEGFPGTYRAYMTRAHRWIRGDWQIIGWIFPRRGGVLSPIGRWRIADNLRRSLLPIALVFAVTSSLFSSANSLLWSALALLSLGAGQLLPSLLRMFGMMIAIDPRFTIGYRIGTSVGELAAACAKTVLLGVFAMQNAVVSIDAVVRSMWRLSVSKRKLLEWQTAYEAAGAVTGGIVRSIRFMWPSLLAASIFFFSNAVPAIDIDHLSFLWASLWVAAPFVGIAISIQGRDAKAVSAQDAAYLHAVAARTYWFFADMVTKETQWLPPDHLQEEPASKRHAHGLGVSPTNLGMYLLSLSASRALGLTTVTTYVARIAGAFESMSRMERYRGHFFNWYELRALAPLAPRYVSSVDSANLALALLAVRNALRETCAAPLLTRTMVEGYDAELAVLSKRGVRAMTKSKKDSVKRRLLRDVIEVAAKSRALIAGARAGDLTPQMCDLMCSGVVHHAVHIRNTLETLRLEEGSEAFEDVFLAARHAEELAEENRDLLGRYLSYAVVPTVSAVTADDVLRAAYGRLRETLALLPSMDSLADGTTRAGIERAGFADAVGRSPVAQEDKDSALAWYGEILARLKSAEDQARAIRQKLASAADDARRYFEEMDFSFLYDEERGLFHMGYNAARDYFDDIFYDLFASEANSASIVGIAKRHAPKEHWAYLSRKLVKSATGAATPVSWAGSLFEYLGTMLYFPVPDGSFWGESARRAVAAHRLFARRLGIPWGMGESASSSMDASENYHYQAFGEPSIGFRRNISDSVVVAPYTTALALPIAPRAATRNLQWLARIGGSGRYGFYDAVDYTAYSLGTEDRGIPVRIYYAHHQGFILSSIANVILSGWVRRMIDAEPALRVATQLFEEKMPDVPPVEPLHALARPRVSGNGGNGEVALAPRRYVSPRPKEPQWHFISNGSYRVALSSAGAGESRREEVAITREGDDPTTESRGIFFYLFDRDRGALWSPAYLPTRTVGEKSSVSLGAQIAVFDKTYEGIETTLTVTVDPGSPVEIRELVVTNRRTEPFACTVGACAEVALARPEEALTHQNFQNLFVESEIAFDGSGVIVSRSDWRNTDRSDAACFLISSSEGDLEGLRMTRGRETFYGSRIDRADPAIMKDPGRGPQELPRHTLDTAVGFVAPIELGPGETRRIAFVISTGETRAAALSALQPFRKYRHVRKVISGADHAGAAALAALGIASPQATTFDALASLLVARKGHASPDLRPDFMPLVGILWKRGISGVRPYVLLTVFGLVDLPLVRQMLACHSYFLHKGVEADIVILNEHRGGYLRTLEDEIDFLLRVHGDHGSRHGSRVHYVRGEELDMNEVEGLRMAATVKIDTGKGTVANQLRAQTRAGAAKLPPLMTWGDRNAAERFAPVSDAWEPTPGRSLEHWNGFGGYDPASRAYVILPNGNAVPPVPWSNIVANEHVGFLATDRGTMFSWARNSRDNKITMAYNDPLSTDTAEAVYVRDEASGAWYCPLPSIGPAAARYEVRHGEGYTEYRTHQGGLGIRLTAHVAPNAPVKYLSLAVKNDCAEARKVAVFGYFDLLLGSFPHETKRHLAFSLHDGNVLVAQNAFRHTFPESRVFVGIAGGAEEFTTSKEEFLGRFGTAAAPAALARQGLSGRLAPEGEPAAVLSRHASLAPGEERTTVFFLGEANSGESLAYLLDKACGDLAASESFVQAITGWRSFPKLTLDLPDRSLALLCNRFLPYQTLVSRVYGRTGFYQISGAFGFRDQIQDVLSLMWHDPALARSHILACAGRQFREGDVLSWWHTYNDFGARTMLSDQHLWLPYAAVRYAAFTGDARVFDEEVPYLEGELPDMERRSIVGTFLPGSTHGTLYEHCVRATERGLTTGAHGLPLIGAADWNDSMNRVGSEGKGESVWLAWFTVILLRDMADLAAARNDNDRAARYRREAERYLVALRSSAWDGSWFRRAYTDAGVPVGTSSARSWRIDSVSQSWAMFALGRTPETESALHSAKHEFRIWEHRAPIAWPPSSPESLDLGTLSDYPPGVRENAGQYNHAALWLAQAMCRVGDPDAAKSIIDAVNPFKQSETPEKALVYRGEPYAVAADIYSAPTYPGRAGWTWYTASSGVLYQTVVEYVLGITLQGNAMRFRPSFPSDWNEATVRYVHKSSEYVIRYAVADHGAPETPTAVSCDGMLMADGVVTLLDDGKRHEVTVSLPRSVAKE